MAFREPAQSHNDYLREHDVARARFNKLAVGLGYDGSDYLEAAAWIALRCASAEQGLRRHERTAALAGLPGLTPAETERLAMLAETCGEVVQAVGKVLRHGWESQSPYGGRPNRVSLEREIGQVRAIVNLMLDSGDVELGKLQAWQRSKRVALGKWTHHQECSMPREEQLAMMQAIREERQGR